MQKINKLIEIKDWKYIEVEAKQYMYQCKTNWFSEFAIPPDPSPSQAPNMIWDSSHDSINLFLNHVIHRVFKNK